jgi:hypothetical protein
MLNGLFKDHLRRVRTAVLKRHTAASISSWLTENTTYAMQPFSYKDHEYQEAILSDTSVETNTRKCSQVGISEVLARKALGLVNVLQPYTVIYTVPTAHFAGTFMKTRVDPVIQGSKTMREMVHRTNDNSEMKQFGDSMLYCKGAASSNAPISIPADHLIHDEVDFCDQDVLTQYQSRLTHSPWRKIDRFSTPTLPNFGIDKFFQESRRHFLMVKCDHCNHDFVPSYYDHVKIPGFDDDLRKITKYTLTRIRWEEAAVICPHCGKVPSLQWPHRRWVCENPSENYVASGRQVSPFDAPNIITPSYLVKVSTNYARSQDFVNFNLGLPAEDKEASLSREDFEKLFCQFEANGLVYVMGVDVGALYHFVIAGVDGQGNMYVVHREQVPMGLARKRYMELKAKYRVICTVIDSTPHAETVMALQAEDPNLYASVYMKSKSLLTHHVVQKEEEKGEGKSFVRQVNVNRSRAFDGYMEFIRGNAMMIQAGEDKDLIIQHHCSMKRVKVYDNESGELAYSWQKTDGNDHYHHAFLYCWVASKIRGIARPTIILPSAQVFSFRLRPK